MPLRMLSRPVENKFAVMRVLIISGEYPPHKTGDAAHAYHLRAQLHQRGIDVHVLTTLMDVPYQENVAYKMPKWDWRFRHALQSHIASVTPDAILLFFNGRMYHNHPMMTFAPTFAKRVAPRTPFVTQFETPGIAVGKSPWSARVIRRILKAKLGAERVSYPHGTLLSDSHRVISLCRAYENALLSEYPPVVSKSVIIPPPPLYQSSIGRDAERAAGRAELGLVKDNFVFLYFGYVYVGKGIETLLHAFSELVKRHAQARLVIVGGPGSDPFKTEAFAKGQAYLDTLKSQAEQLDLGATVKWTGECDATSDRGARLMAAADSFVLPFSQGVRLNNSSFSAVAAWRKPIVTTRGDLTDSEIQHRKNAILAIPNDFDSIRTGMESVMTDIVLRRKLEAGVTELFASTLSWDVVINKTLQTFE